MPYQVTTIEGNTVITEGTVIETNQILLATTITTLPKILPEQKMTSSVTNVYFE
jgi:hypothetical protein